MFPYSKLWVFLMLTLVPQYSNAFDKDLKGIHLGIQIPEARAKLPCLKVNTIKLDNGSDRYFYGECKGDEYWSLYFGTREGLFRAQRTFMYYKDQPIFKALRENLIAKYGPPKHEATSKAVTNKNSVIRYLCWDECVLEHHDGEFQSGDYLYHKNTGASLIVKYHFYGKPNTTDKDKQGDLEFNLYDPVSEKNNDNRARQEDLRMKKKRSKELSNIDF